MASVLVVFEGDWADEINLHGFWVTTEERWTNHLESAKALFEKEQPREVYIGTNQSIMYENYDDYRRNFDVTYIEDAQADVFEKYFGIGSFGHFPLVEE